MSMTGMNRSIEQIIQQAMREGKFDDLEGKGKPIKLKNNPHADPEWQLAYDMLSNEGFSLPWMEKRNEIERGITNTKDALERKWIWVQEQRVLKSYPIELIEEDWQKAINQFYESCEKINGLIKSYNLEIPNDKFFRMKVDVEKSLEGIMAGNSDKNY